MAECLLAKTVCSAPTGKVLPWVTMKIFASFSPNSTKSHLLEADREALHYLKEKVTGRGTEMRKTKSEIISYYCHSLTFKDFRDFY